MNRSLSILLALACATCGPSEAPPDREGPSAASPSAIQASDSTMVVATTAMVPSDGRPVVVFLGTSLTAGLGLEREEDTYVAVLEAMADSAGAPFHAVNAGVSGDTSAGGLRRLEWILREPVDVLFLELGGNDGLRGQDPEALAANLSEIVRRTRAAWPDARFVVAGMEAPPNMGEGYTAEFRAVFPRVAEEAGAALVPFLLDGVAGIPDLNQEDRIHPTAEGHRRIAATVWPVLRSTLDQHATSGRKP